MAPQDWRDQSYMTWNSQYFIAHPPMTYRTVPAKRRKISICGSSKSVIASMMTSGRPLSIRVGQARTLTLGLGAQIFLAGRYQVGVA